MLNSKGCAIYFNLILYSNLLLGAESSKEGCIGLWILGAPEGSSWPAGARVHVAAGLGPPWCCVPALSCCTTTQTGQHRWLPVCSFWSQYCSHAHRLLQLSQNTFFLMDCLFQPMWTHWLRVMHYLPTWRSATGLLAGSGLAFCLFFLHVLNYS